MNLINDPWIPIKRTDGTEERIAPWQLTESDNPIVELSASRPDFNGALIQFLIGLLQTTTAPQDETEWINWLERPPASQDLENRFQKYTYAFELQGEKGYFMQDFDSLEDATSNGIAELLIESPGDNTIKENKDHFIKRGRIHAICPCCTATALFTLQTNAPSGGQGHRTSLRGGGPLSTLAIVDDNGTLPNDLWRNVWLNVLNESELAGLTGNNDNTALENIFPWLALTRTSEITTGQDTTPLDASPLQMYWGMPRRIRIDWQTVREGKCDICNLPSTNLVTTYRTKNYGANYTGAWQHPLSPYTLSNQNEILPQHPQPGGVTYQHWFRIAIPSQDNEPSYFNAQVISRYQDVLYRINAFAQNQDQQQLRVHAFGYDMDNMKARCWYESSFPLITVTNDIRMEFSHLAQLLTETAGKFAGFVRNSVKHAWFSRPADAKGDISFINQSFYDRTETEFFRSVEELKNSLRTESENKVLRNWYDALVKASEELFEYWASRGNIAQANPRRIAKARQDLIKKMNSRNIRQTLRLNEEQ